MIDVPNVWDIREGVFPEYGNKIINTRSSSDCCNEILVKFKAVPNDEVLAKMCVDGVVEIEKVFDSCPGKEQLEHRFGLDLWYALKIGTKSNPRQIAETLSLNAEVSTVEYGVRYGRGSDGLCLPYLPEGNVPTRAIDGTGSLFDDPYLVNQWNYVNIGDRAVAKDSYAGGDINVKDVWKSLTCGDNSIIVAVVDEGVKHNHPDLAGNMWTGPNGEHGRNFVDKSGSVTWSENGDSGHGTHCAGTIAALNNNGLGVSGVAGGSGKGDGVRIMSCQIFSGKQGGYTSIVAKAIKYAADNGASIISCSFGYAGGIYKSDAAYRKGNDMENSMEESALRYFEASKNNDVLDGGIAIFASGNDGDPYATYPGALNDIISVSAFGPDYLPTYYTNYGPGCNIVAPGGEAYHDNVSGNHALGMILSTVPNELYKSDYGYMQGTSMACPHVTGIAALALSYSKKIGKHFTVREFKDMILTSANDFDTRLIGDKQLIGKSFSLAPYYHKMGTGSIDAWKLMMKIEGTPCLTAEAGEEQWLDLSGAFGTASVNLTYLKVEYSKADAEAIGMTKEPYIKYGRLFIHPTKCGAAKFKITAVGGGEAVGGDDAIGGMGMSQTVSVVVRPFKSENGGWL